MEGQERFYGRGVISGSQIRQLIERDPPLITGFRDLDAQIQPNGIDLTLAEIKRFNGSGRLTIDNSERVLPELLPTPEIDRETVYLEQGAFHILYNETVALPNDLMALGRPRSTLNRCGATIHTAVWDAGYHGRSTSLLVVNNPHGIFIQIGARIAQLVFLTLSEMTEAGYRGIYQGENRL